MLVDCSARERKRCVLDDRPVGGCAHFGVADMSKSTMSCFALVVLGTASACVTSVYDGQKFNHSGGNDAFERTLNLAGYGTKPNVPITVAVRHQQNQSWDAIATVFTSSNKQTYGGDDFYPWSYGFVAQDVLDSTCYLSSDPDCRVAQSNYAPVTLRFSQGGSQSGNLVTFEQGGLQCVIDRINQGESGMAAGFNCSGSQSPAITLQLRTSWDVASLQISAADTCAIDGQGKVTCWGHSAAAGQPRVVTSYQGPLADVALGLWANPVGCTLDDDGQLACWGSSQLPSSQSDVAQLVASVSGNRICWVDDFGGVDCGNFAVPQLNGAVATLAVGNNHACAGFTDGDVYCWGSIANDWGQMTPPPGLDFVEGLAVGDLHSCARGSQGDVECWGASTLGRTDPPQGLGPVTHISAGAQHTCVVHGQGDVACWGQDEQGQSSVPGNLGPAVQVEAGKFHSCALQSDGVVRCWGANDFGGSVGLTDVPGVFSTP